jgi:LysR family cys regulon transcriptional activator
MTLQQLRIFRQAVLSGFSLSKAAEALYTSQSGVSRHIIELEAELGVPLLSRKGKRILGLTEAGREIYRFTEKIVQETDNLDSFRSVTHPSRRGRVDSCDERIRKRVMPCRRLLIAFECCIQKCDLR